MKPIVDFELFIKNFPNVKNESKRLAEKLLPLYPSEGLAEIVGYLLSDGHIDWCTSDGNPRTRKAIFYSNHESECIEFLRLCQNIFKFQGKVQKYHSNTGFSDTHAYRAVINNATIARILILAGIPAGDKTKTEFSVPEWIMNGNSKIKRSFLRALYNFDGSVPHVKKDRENCFQMGYTLNKKKDIFLNGIAFARQIRDMFKEFGVWFGKPINFETKNHKSSRTIMISVDNQKSIINFYNEIGFMNIDKQRKLLNAVETIAVNGRICINKDFLYDFKRRFYTDKKAVDEINKHSMKRYTKRQFEHMRRNESKMPFDMLFSTIKIMKKEKEIERMPRYVRDVYEIYKDYRSRSPRMNSSNISLATLSGNC